MAYLSTTHEGVKLSIHVQARASRCALVGLHGDALKIALNVPPVDGKANEALRRFLSEVFRVSFTGVSIVSGAFSRNKIVLLAGCNEADALEVLAAAGLPASSKP
ncbi:YggU family protein [Candidatus Sumerlaeota bacterium]|nr:YggU family protein [Candidatus Sumerlaeota bacterium]